MSDMIGMDVEAVSRTASTLRHKAVEIRSVEAQIDRIVGQIGGSWQGHAARRFVGDWHGHHRATLQLLADRIDGLGQSALKNVAEQESASRGGAGAPGGSGAGRSGGASSGWNRLVSFLDESVPYAAFGPTVAARFAANKYSIGRYSTQWNAHIDRVKGWFPNGLAIGTHRAAPEDLLRFKRSPVLHDLNHLQGFLKGAERFASGAGAVDSGSSAYYEFKSGDVRNGAVDGVNAMTRAVDASPAGKVPLVHWAMMDVRIAGEVVRAATNTDVANGGIDYSAKGIGQVLTASPGEWFTAIKETSPQFVKTIFHKVL